MGGADASRPRPVRRGSGRPAERTRAGQGSVRRGAGARITADFRRVPSRGGRGVAAARPRVRRRQRLRRVASGTRAGETRDRARRGGALRVLPARETSRPRRPRGRVAGQVALARRVSPSRGGRHLAVALALVRHLPRTLAALEVGALSEWRAEIVVRETAVLAPEHQSAVDAELFDGLGPEPLPGCGGAAASLDSPGPRHDELRDRVPSGGSRVAVHAALTAAAAASRADGDGRSRGQLTADLLVERVTGQATAAAENVEAQVVITDRAPDRRLRLR